MKSNSGQALLIMVLVMAVALTIGLAVVSQSITDIKISHQEEESSRAFSVAEAGIEQALKLGPGDYPTGDITARVTETAQGGGTEFVSPAQITQGETQSIWLIGHDDDGNLLETPFYIADSIKICWEETTPTETAIEATLFYKEAGVYKVFRGAYDAEAASLSRLNSFEVPTENCDNLKLGRGKTLTTSGLGTLILLQLRPLYNQAKIGVEGVGGSGGVLPVQGKCYESSAEVPGSGITRKVQQCQFYKAPPGIFDYALYSGGNLSK